MPAPDQDLETLLTFARENGRVCPQPQRWNDLWGMLPNRRRAGSGYVPSAPLILAAWWCSSDAQKRERLAMHIKYAADNGALESVDEFLRGLQEDQWHHEGE